MIVIIITVIIIPLLIAIIAVEWPKIKKYIPVVPNPLIRISYQKHPSSVSIIFENIGNEPADYFTADIRSTNGTFSIKETWADFDLSAPGIGGSWLVISGKNILPQQKGSVELLLTSSNMSLEPPKVKSDSRHKFAGTFNISAGPEETYEEYKKKSSNKRLQRIADKSGSR